MLHRPKNIAGAKLSFKADKSVTQGAILLTNEETRCYDVAERALFEKYLLDNYQSWYDFAAEKYPVKRIDDIRLVIGLDMTRECSMLAFAQNQIGATFEFEVSASNVASIAVERGQWTYENAVVFDNYGPQHIDGERTSQGPDQCIFLRSLRVHKRAFPLAPRVINASAEPRDPGLDGPTEDGEASVVGADTPGSGTCCLPF